MSDFDIMPARIVVGPDTGSAIMETAAVVFGIIFIIIGIFQLVANYYFNAQVQAVSQWPRTNATITESKIRSNLGNDTYAVDVTYEYTVNGQRYHSSNVHVACDCVVNGVVAKGLTIGSTISIYYNPYNPGSAYIVPGEKVYSRYISGIIWIVIGLLLLFWSNRRSFY
jgi:hypothetical protein